LILTAVLLLCLWPQAPSPASPIGTPLVVRGIGSSAIPNVFSARFTSEVTRAVSAARKRKGIGYVSEEAGRWSERDGRSLLGRFLDMHADSPERARAERFLEEQGDPDGTLSEREKDQFAELTAYTYFGAWRRAFHAVGGPYLAGRFASPPPSPVLRGMRRALLDGRKQNGI
jgi:hypothetical protein